jgi:outer membrane immunogenic protein
MSTRTVLVLLAAILAQLALPGESRGDWSGWYGGAAAGGKWAGATWTTTRVGDPPSAAAVNTLLDKSSPDRFTPSGLRLGGYAGYNWQSNRWVYGFELDGAWANAADEHRGIPGCKIECAPGAPGPGNDTSSVRLTWDASARGRVGYLVQPDLLVYATGGIAWQSIYVSGTCESTLSDPTCLVSPPFAGKTQLDRSILSGWTLGAGVERELPGRWLLRAEYRYAHFGTVNGVLWAGQPVADPGSDAVHYEVAVHTHVVIVGLTYRF